MIPFPDAAVGKLKKRSKELADLAYTCRMLDRHEMPKDPTAPPMLCEDCGKRAKEILDQAKDDAIAEGMKLLALLGNGKK